jgi:2-polyprenyl-6-methoxyphenol hydroxylase-like FAD-dependent oxidoreductase
MTPSVLVVGGGIAGRAAARALLLRGVECAVLEQRPPAEQLGMGLNLTGNATRALAALGVADEVVPLGVPVLRREYRDAAGKLLFDVDDEELWRGVGPPVCVRHGHLLRALRPPAPVVWQTGRAIGAVQVPSGVEVQLEGGRTTSRYDLVIGADGVHSTLRSAVGGAVVRPSSMASSCWRFVVDNPGVDCWTVWSGPRHTFLMIPVDDSRVYGYAACSRGGPMDADPGCLRRAFAHFPDPVTEVTSTLLAGRGELHHGTVDEVRLQRWHEGRLVLVGDAAHATGPVWAQGAAMALEDALVLASVVSEVALRDVGAELERLRGHRTDHVRRATARMSRLARLPGPVRTMGASVLGPRAYRDAYLPLRDPLPTVDRNPRSEAAEGPWRARRRRR